MREQGNSVFTFFSESKLINIYQRKYYLSVIGTGLIGALFMVSGFDLLKVFELRLLDSRYLFSRHQRLPKEVTVVQVDDASLVEVNEKSWDRRHFRAIVERISGAGARVLAFDGLFTFETKDDGAQDMEFANVMRKAGNVLLGYYRSNDRNRRIVRPISLFEEASAGIGLLEHYSDIDGLSRKMKIAEVAGGKVRPSLALLAIARYLGADPNKEMNWDPAKSSMVISPPGGRKVEFQCPYDGLVYMNFSPKGPIGGTWPIEMKPGLFDVLPASAILYDRGDWRDLVKDRIVLFGYSTPTAHDIFPTIDGNIPGVYLHATCITNILDGNLVVQLPDWSRYAILFASGIITSVVFFTLRPAFSVAAMILGLMAYFAFCYGIFHVWAIWIPMAEPLALVLCLFVAILSARYLVIAFENARMYISVLEKEKLEKDLRTAFRIQKEMLPKDCPDIDGLRIGAFSQPAKLVGGDYYDFFCADLDRGILHTVVADVSGKGIPAALIVAMTKTIMHALMGPNLDPPAYLAKINTFLEKELGQTMYVTALFFSLEMATGKGRFISAGHEAPMIYRASTGKCEAFPIRGFFLGMFAGVDYKPVEIELDRGDKVIMLTDGVLDATDDSGKRFESERLRALVEEHRDLAAPEMAEKLRTTILEYSDESDLFDDFTVVVIDLV